ncbi:MAG: TerC family protein [Hyphomicrobiales bacterium]
MSQLIDGFIALSQVVLIDVVLAADNAVVVGMAAAGISPALRRRAIFWGIIAAVVLRILFATVTTELMSIVGLTLAGGILLLWVCWKMWREIKGTNAHVEAGEAPGGMVPEGAFAFAGTAEAPAAAPTGKTFAQAMIQIVLADVSMSLDNVLAVAGAAKGHLGILAIGLVLSVALMGVAASYIASLLERHRWIAWIGLLVILYVALEMIWRGAGEVACVGGMGDEVCRNGLTGPIRARMGW